jgi:anti-anti-sigma factor
MPAQTELMRMERRAHGILLRLGGRYLDETNAVDLADSVLGCVPEGVCGNVYLDLRSVEYMSAAAIGQLVLLDRRVRDADGIVVLLHVHPFLKQLLQICRLTDFLDVPGTELPDEDIALRSGFGSTVGSSIPA